MFDLLWKLRAGRVHSNASLRPSFSPALRRRLAPAASESLPTVFGGRRPRGIGHEPSSSESQRLNHHTPAKKMCIIL